MPQQLESILKDRLVTLRSDLAGSMAHQLKKVGKLPGGGSTGTGGATEGKVV